MNIQSSAKQAIRDLDMVSSCSLLIGSERTGCSSLRRRSAKNFLCSSILTINTGSERLKLYIHKSGREAVAKVNARLDAVSREII